ncbi:type IV toxin-antitoxin system AbiEi family antitoxin domain-containing protein [Gordonia zhaorongruii]|uniref:type IV toxin-antitoxin system AbiEi family antitoxin domain-containing protein n=1 Tax=Gordonia zhaorongruii TaxID=2597659 RepID=UPI0010472E72|nr:type IV toxin-antitoxin system AbiEi family antitoxin domain-containing protein [Gordonia zhaorongruii]
MTVQLLPADRYGLIRRSDALEAGWSDSMLAAAVRRGELTRLALGVFVVGGPQFEGPGGADSMYRLRCIATSTGARDGAATVLSHHSAAAVHGLPLLDPPRGLVHVTSRSSRGGGLRSGRHVHTTSLSDDDVVDADGLAVTGLARTAVDIAISSSFASALTVFDAVLRLGVDRSECQEQLARRRGFGARRAWPALIAADGRAASVGESWSRAQMTEARLPMPHLQCEHRVGGRTYFSDFEWDSRLIGEFDGNHKYGRLRKPGESVADAVLREKRREDDLRSLGFMVVRWDWADLLHGRMVPKLRAWLH